MKVQRAGFSAIVAIFIVLLFSVGALTVLSGNGRVLSHDEQWLSPFESITTTTYDLGDGFTATATTHTVSTVTSVNHTDQVYFSPEQWEAILEGIADGSIFWED